MSLARTRSDIRCGFSTDADETRAVTELADTIDHPDAGLVILFCSSHYDLDRIASAVRTEFSTPVIGCTTSGELTPAGYRRSSITGLSLGRDHIRSSLHLLEPLTSISKVGRRIVVNLKRKLWNFSTTRPGSGCFGLLLTDGLSRREEQVTSYLHNALGAVPIVGGSAGDDLRFEETHVFYEGRFHSNAAVVALISTDLPFQIIKSQHFVATETKLVITEADPERRIVSEINGRPAAEEYARLVSVSVDELQPAVFSRHPILLQFQGRPYVRSIQKVHPDGSLSFYCAIEAGLVLSLGRGVNLVDSLGNAFAAVRRDITPEAVLGFDCILRRLEIEERNLESDIAPILRENNVLGFNTYGEQCDGLHVNQTFTGIALGAARRGMP